jgi:hypothetical protein
VEAAAALVHHRWSVLSWVLVLEHVGGTATKAQSCDERHTRGSVLGRQASRRMRLRLGFEARPGVPPSALLMGMVMRK